MSKIEKQSIPIFLNENGTPVAAIMFLNRQRIIFTLKPADENELIELYEKKTNIIKATETSKELDF